MKVEARWNSYNNGMLYPVSCGCNNNWFSNRSSAKVNIKNKIVETVKGFYSRGFSDGIAHQIPWGKLYIFVRACSSRWVPYGPIIFRQHAAGYFLHFPPRVPSDRQRFDCGRPKAQLFFFSSFFLIQVSHPPCHRIIMRLMLTLDVEMGIFVNGFSGGDVECWALCSGGGRFAVRRPRVLVVGWLGHGVPT